MYICIVYVYMYTPVCVDLSRKLVCNYVRKILKAYLFGHMHASTHVRSNVCEYACYVYVCTNMCMYMNTCMRLSVCLHVTS